MLNVMIMIEVYSYPDLVKLLLGYKSFALSEFILYQYRGVAYGVNIYKVKENVTHELFQRTYFFLNCHRAEYHHNNWNTKIKRNHV